MEVSNTLNFTQAANNLHLSQSSLSRQIQLLEEEMGAPLLIRNNRAVALTSFGEQFVREITPSLSNLEAIYQKLKNAAKPAKILKIGIYQPVSINIFSDFLDSIQHCFPDYSVQLIRCKAPELKANFISGDLDIIITTYRLNIDISSTRETIIGTIPAEILISKNFSEPPKSFNDIGFLNGKELIVLKDEIAPSCKDEYLAIADALQIIPGSVSETFDLSWSLLSVDRESFSFKASTYPFSELSADCIIVPENIYSFKKRVIWRPRSDIDLGLFLKKMDVCR